MTIGHQEAEAVRALLRTATRAEILPRFRRLTGGDIRQKSGPLDLVTDADLLAERHITTGLRDLFPGCLVVGEEAAAADPGILDGLSEAPLAFVVDPVDGTANFAAGLPLFACMAAALVRGEVVAGWIHDPLGDDTAMALRGEGAWLQDEAGNRTRLRVAAPCGPERMVGIINWGGLPEPLRTRAVHRLPKLAAVLGLRCAAHEYRVISGGHAHASLYTKLMPWDHCAGWLLHREAGGYSAQFDGSPWLPAKRSGGLLMASDAASWLALRETLLEP